MSPARPPAARMERATRSAQRSMSPFGVAHHGGLAGGAGRGMHPHHLLARHRKHAKRVVGAQVVLGGERELRQVGQRAQILGMHTGVVERRAGSAARAHRRAAAWSSGARVAAPAVRHGWRSRWRRARRGRGAWRAWVSPSQSVLLWWGAGGAFRPRWPGPPRGGPSSCRSGRGTRQCARRAGCALRCRRPPCARPCSARCRWRSAHRRGARAPPGPH